MVKSKQPRRKWLWMILTILIIGSSVVVIAASNESRTCFIYPPFKHTWGVVRGTPAKLFMLVGKRATFAEPLGLCCVRLDCWDDPKIAGDDDEVTVYGVNSNQNMVIYNKSMFELGIYGDRETGSAKLNKPWGVAANNKGDVFVTDLGNNRVVKLFNPKSELKYVSAFGSLGSNNGQFNSPRGIALDNRGMIYVADYLNNRVQIFNSSGVHQRTIFGVLGPIAVAVIDAEDRWSYSYGPRREEFLIVVDSLDARISKYSLEGDLLERVTSGDWGAGTCQLQFCTIDYFSQVLLTDRKNNCIWKLDRDLKMICRFGRKGTSDYEFDDPRGITMYRRFGQTFVAEREGAQYLWVAVDLLHPQAKWDEKTRILTITGIYSEPALVDMDLLDASDKIVTRVAMIRSTAGPFQHEWDGNIKTFPKSGLTDAEQSQAARFQDGKPVPPGSYKLRIASKATYSSIKDFVQVLTIPVTL